MSDTKTFLLALADCKFTGDKMSDEQKQEQPKPKTLVQKLCEVMKAVGYLQKKGNNAKQDYKYIREADVVAKMRDEFASRNVFIFPTMLHHERTKLSKVEYDKVKETYVTDLVMRWTFVDGDSGEERFCDIPGCSASPGDKGVYVAMTGSEKYLLMKSFLLPTGDDPEDDENEEKGSTEAAKAVGEAKIAKLKEKAPTRAPSGNTLFWLTPHKFNGHRAVFVNLKEFGSGLNEVAAEGLRQILKRYLKGKMDGEMYVPTSGDDSMPQLLAELDSCGVPTKQLTAE